MNDYFIHFTKYAVQPYPLIYQNLILLLKTSSIVHYAKYTDDTLFQHFGLKNNHSLQCLFQFFKGNNCFLSVLLNAVALITLLWNRRK